MRYTTFYSNFSEFRKANDVKMKKDILLHELADVIVSRKSEVIDKLNHSGNTIDSSITEEELTEVVMNNLNNKKFVDGVSEIISKKNKDDFENFSNAGGNTVSKDMNGDVSEDIKKTLSEKTDTGELKARVDIFKKEAGVISKERDNYGALMLIMGLAAGTIWFIASPYSNKFYNKIVSR